jgi:glutamyl/glutaminyl-tRNA synthetase
MASPLVNVVSRFAPAPTGFLHLGHVVNAIYVWGVVRAVGGRVLLRIEDHDRQRSRTRFERAILEDLDWLGFIPDEPSLDAFRAGSCEGRQSDRHAVYRAALERLRAEGVIYGCRCSRRERAGAAIPRREQPYPGTCAGKGLSDGPGVGLRLRVGGSVERFDSVRRDR